ncbi:hypothetical protein FQA39_LY12343 [Lamprigera yunnana]|nr:hypothetical protein FQA39_LY12343 [Lamprigera yunnana]
MPQQFIKVKNREVQSTSSAFSETVKKLDSSRFGSCTNISNSNSDICRICHCEADIGNPLLSPCYCSGSLKYVHQSCLQQWLAASDTRSCELCKFNFILHTKIKPIAEWRRLEMTNVERRRLLCAILFHFVAAICVIWSLFVLIDRATEEVQKGLIAWPFWTKLVVVAVGFTGGAVFMYIQCRQYLQLFSRWKAHNRIILVQNAPDSASEKIPISPPTPNFNITVQSSPATNERSSEVIANIECSVSPHYNTIESTYKFEESINPTEDMYLQSYNSSLNKVMQSPSLSDPLSYTDDKLITSLESTSFDALELNIQEVLALDVEHSAQKSKISLAHSSRVEDRNKNKGLFKSLPNLSGSSENLLV